MLKPISSSYRRDFPKNPLHNLKRLSTILRLVEKQVANISETQRSIKEKEEVFHIFHDENQAKLMTTFIRFRPQTLEDLIYAKCQAGSLKILLWTSFDLHYCWQKPLQVQKGHAPLLCRYQTPLLPQQIYSLEWVLMVNTYEMRMPVSNYRDMKIHMMWSFVGFRLVSCGFLPYFFFNI